MVWRLPVGQGESRLCGLNFRGCAEGFPRELADLERLTVLNLGEAGLRGEIPEELGDLEDLRELHLHANGLDGGIPESVAMMPRLEVLDLRGNQLAGPIPSTLGNPSTMWWLGLNENRFVGEIPEHFTSLRRLAVLNLSDNRLTGQIPIGLGDLNELGVLFLAGNQITGCVPDRLLDVRDVDVMDFGLPLCSQEREVVVTVEAGRFWTGEGLGGFAVGFAMNWASDAAIELVGRIADSSSGMVWTVSGDPARVTEIDLGGYALTGTLPAGLGDLDELRVLNLGSGDMTTEAFGPRNRASLKGGLPPRRNRLTGPIPVELGRLEKLEVLNLGYNDLDGEIPGRGR